jgi:hypothetical protein
LNRIHHWRVVLENPHDRAGQRQSEVERLEPHRQGYLGRLVMRFQPVHPSEISTAYDAPDRLCAVCAAFETLAFERAVRLEKRERETMGGLWSDLSGFGEGSDRSESYEP